MKGFLLDTCALSEPIKPRPNENFLRWFDAQEREMGISQFYISVLSLGEIQKGISKLADPKKQRKFTSFLEATEALFQGRILPIHASTSKLWGEIEGRLESKGKHIASIDGLLAATAITHSLTIVTRNVADFFPIMAHYPPTSDYDIKGVTFNPWD